VAELPRSDPWPAGADSSPICNELIDRFGRSGAADLVRELTFEFPVRVISRLLGLPEKDFAASSAGRSN